MGLGCVNVPSLNFPQFLPLPYLRHKCDTDIDNRIFDNRGVNKDKSPKLDLAEKLLSSYEVGILSNAKLSDGDKLVEDNLVRNKLKQCLGLKYRRTLEDGTDGNEVDVLTTIVIASLVDAIQKPNVSKLKDIAAITGELKETNSEVTISVVDKSLEELAMGEDK